jgi:hypothetical protein
MSQVLRPDKIGQLTHSAGNIIMAASAASPAYLTVGGRQFTITSNLSVALPSMTANTRYQVFAVQSGGVVSLAISQNENSVGPAGFLSWKLVGSLYSNGLVSVGFGSFVNIKGVPSTVDIPFTFTMSTGSWSVLTGHWSRVGETIICRMNGTNTAAGSGIYSASLPFNVNNSKVTTTTALSNGTTTGQIDTILGSFYYEASGGAAMGASGFVILPALPPYGVVFFASTGFSSSSLSTSGNTFTDRYTGYGSGASNAVNSRFGANFKYPATVLSNTPIEDL